MPLQSQPLGCTYNYSQKLGVWLNGALELTLLNNLILQVRKPRPEESTPLLQNKRSLNCPFVYLFVQYILSAYEPDAVLDVGGHGDPLPGS